MRETYIPARDAEFDAWFESFAAIVAEHGSKCGLTPSMQSNLSAAWSEWHERYTAHLQASQLAKEATATKAAARRKCETLARKTAQFMRVFPKTPDDLRQQAGLASRERQVRPPVPGQDALTAPPPQIELDASRRGRIGMRFGFREETGVRYSIPRFARAVAFQYALDALPTDARGWREFTYSGRARCVHEISFDHPTTIYYRACYVNRNLQQGPWSDPVEVGVKV